MRVLLTGAAGFVGRVALDQLSENHEVTAFDVRLIEGHPEAILGDVLDYKAVEEAVAGHDAVVNTIMAPNAAYNDGGPGFTINTVGAYNLFEAARVHGAYFVRRGAHRLSGATGNLSHPRPLSAQGQRHLCAVEAFAGGDGAQFSPAAWNVDRLHTALGHYRRGEDDHYRRACGGGAFLGTYRSARRGFGISLRLRSRRYRI
jgi:hypothetical protein